MCHLSLSFFLVHFVCVFVFACLSMHICYDILMKIVGKHLCVISLFVLRLLSNSIDKQSCCFFLFSFLSNTYIIFLCVLFSFGNCVKIQIFWFHRNCRIGKISSIKCIFKRIVAILGHIRKCLRSNEMLFLFDKSITTKNAVNLNRKLSGRNCDIAIYISK